MSAQEKQYEAGSAKKKEKRKAHHSIPRKAKENKFAKTPEQLIRFFSLPKETMMCQHCLYRTDIDPEYVNLPDYQLAISKETKNIRQFQGRSYILRSNIIYPESEFQELESAYHEVYAKLDEAKLEQVPLIRKIKLMAEILYQRQHVYNERPMLDPDEFKKMLENAKPSLRGLNNKFINSVKAEVGLLLDASGASSLVIETLEGAGLTVRRKTIARQKAWHVQAHIEIVGAFITENPSCPKCRQFHNIHESHHSNTTSTHDVSHFTTILLKALPKKLSIPFNNPNQEKSIHNEKDRSIENTRLVDLREGSLHSTKDYMNALKSLINIPKAEAYLKTQVLIAPMYYPGQLYIQCAIVHSLKSRDSSGIPEQILHIIPMIGPLHVSLNSRETVFLLNYDFFDLLFHPVFGHNKVLAKKPKPYKINLLLELTYQGWSRVRSIVMQKFERSKDPEARYLINLLDNIVLLVLDFYPIIFCNGNWEAYKEAMFRIWMVFYQYQQRHYNKLLLMFLSDVFYWFSTNHPIMQILTDSIHVFNDYYVENFHSSLRQQIQESNMVDQQLEYLEEHISLFLLNFFVNVYRNIGKLQIILSKTHSKPEAYEFPTLKTQKAVWILASGIEKNCKAFQKILESSDKKAKPKNSEVIEISDDTNDESFFLDESVDSSNLDLLVEGAINTLANV
ncbi:hypothetical protein C2G38_2176506 [Gigaspora rosea]|uniref:Uncharacterized protein n=1 Tax=Gigaspora rosea TaxID=44941 RepID=A0A397VG74_9GLOM|nr:hypothetical protein C2G38_2176506 [Gigaspora rosea]